MDMKQNPQPPTRPASLQAPAAPDSNGLVSQDTYAGALRPRAAAGPALAKIHGQRGGSYVKTKQPIWLCWWKWWKTHLRILKVWVARILNFWPIFIGRPLQVELVPRKSRLLLVILESGIETNIHLHTAMSNFPSVSNLFLGYKDKSQISAGLMAKIASNFRFKYVLKHQAAGKLWKQNKPPKLSLKEKRAVAAKKQLWVSWMDGCKATETQHHCQFPLPLSKKGAVETVALKTAETGPLTFQSTSPEGDPLASLQRVASNLQKRFKLSTSSEGSTFLQL